jgi:hypothetical protein
MGHEFDEIPSRDDYFGMEIVRTGECPPQETIDLLSYNFKPRAGGMEVSFKNKQANFPVLLIRYPSHFSTITEECKVGCVVGGLVSIYRVIDSPTLFAEAIEHFFDLLKARRFSFTSIRRGILKFLTRNCRKEYTHFLIQHFFAAILQTWPHRADIRASRVINEESIRQDLLDNVPLVWRKRTLRKLQQQTDDDSARRLDRIIHHQTIINQSTRPLQPLPLRNLLCHLPPPPYHLTVARDAAPASQPQRPEDVANDSSDDTSLFSCQSEI